MQKYCPHCGAYMLEIQKASGGKVLKCAVHGEMHPILAVKK